MTFYLYVALGVVAGSLFLVVARWYLRERLRRLRGLL